MPKKSIINPEGTGDYEDIPSWVSGESEKDYGEPTELYLDGFFYLGEFGLDLLGTWPNGIKIVSGNDSIAFNGVSRRFCGLSSISELGTIVNYGHDITIIGLELYNGIGNLAYSNLIEGGEFNALNCLFEDNQLGY